MKVPSLSLVLFCCILALQVLGQGQTIEQELSDSEILRCGTSFADEAATRQRMFDNRANRVSLLEEAVLLKSQSSGNHQKVYVPLQFHLVADANGQGRIDIQSVLDAICYTNQLYNRLPIDLNKNGIADDTLSIVFYLNGPINYIDNNILYNHSDASLVNYLMSIHRVTGAANVFIGLTIPSGGQGTTLGYYSRFLDCMYLIRGTVNSSSATLAHELGHYFTLAHPHFGWDGLDYTADPVVMATGCAPTVTLNGEICEKVARSGGSENCQIAADGFCDTKPDYNFGIFSFCTNNIPAKDPDCVDLIQPNVNNIMSYFNDACTNNFTPQQAEAMYLDIVSRGYIYNQALSNIPITEAPLLFSPIGGQTAFYPAAVTLNWAGVTGASSYLVTVQEYVLGIPTQTVLSYIVYGTQITFAAQASRNYGWKVKPLSTGNLCHNFESVTEFFVTGNWGLSVADTEELSSFSRLYPNPIQAGQNIRIEIDADDYQKVGLSIYNSLGQLLMPERFFEFSGQGFLELPSSTLSAGLYLLKVENDKGQRALHRLVITN